jgi:hypothetical protein
MNSFFTLIQTSLIIIYTLSCRSIRIEDDSIARSLERTRQKLVRVYVSNKKETIQETFATHSHHYYFFFVSFCSSPGKGLHNVFMSLVFRVSQNDDEKRTEHPSFVRFIVDDVSADRK